MEIAFNLIILVLTVVTIGGVARRWNLPGPLLLVLVGIVGSFVPRFDHVSLDRSAPLEVGGLQVTARGGGWLIQQRTTRPWLGLNRMPA